MFDLTAVGKKISMARKRKNLTQLNLADQLGVSFQAVSNWERGCTMPDITKLSEVASNLGMSVDELLCQENQAVTHALDHLKSSQPDTDLSSEQVADILSILEPEQTDDFFLKNQAVLAPSELAKACPFLSRQLCDKLLKSFLRSNDFERAVVVVPFAAKETLEKEIMEKVEEGADVTLFLPFLASAKVVEILWKQYEKAGIDAIRGYLPFVNMDVAEKVASIEYRRNGMQSIQFVAPFLSREKLNALAKRAVKEHGIGMIIPLFAFIDRSFIEDCIHEMFLNEEDDSGKDE